MHGKLMLVPKVKKKKEKRRRWLMVIEDKFNHLIRF
jgi:hypothetical protein